jgi:hypothetical protein
MLLNPIRELLETVQLKNFDGPRVWESMKDAPCSLIDTPEEFLPYCSLSSGQKPIAPHLIVTPFQNEFHVSALLDVGVTGLANLLFQQLCYVPKFAVLEWHMQLQQTTMRDLVYCMGYSNIVETYETQKPAFASVSGRKIEPLISESLELNPTQTHSWCFGTILELRKRALIVERLVTHNVWNVHLLQTGVYGIQ